MTGGPKVTGIQQLCSVQISVAGKIRGPRDWLGFLAVDHRVCHGVGGVGIWALAGAYRHLA